MIVRNEAHQLAECLAPVASLFDEIVVVDTGSHDATKQIAAQFTSQVFDFPWRDDFSLARNESLRRATGDWVFWLDADDRLEPPDRDRLEVLLDNLPSERRAAFLMDTVCTPRYACDGISLISHVRLFRRHEQIRWQGRVHEQLAPSLLALGYELAASDVRVQHLGYRDAGTHQRKLHRDLRLLRMDYAVDPDQPSTLVHLGMAHFHLGQRTEARQYFGRLVRNGDVPHDYLRQVFAALATIALQEGKLAEALALLDRAVQLFPHDEHLLYLQADCLYEADRFDEAHATLLRILRSSSRSYYHGGVPGEIKEKLAPRKLGDLLRIKRQYALAEAQLRAVLSRFPDDTITWHLLGRVYLDCRQKARLAHVVEQLNVCPQGAVFGSLLWAMWYLAANDSWTAEPFINAAISQAPHMPLARVLRAECLAQRGAPPDAQARALRDVLRVQPGNMDAARMLAQLQGASPPPARPAAPAASPSQFGTSVVVAPGIPGGIGLA
jgi:tetratricopeptide (TPR) repeat protein